jgi:hypothetical protein
LKDSSAKIERRKEEIGERHRAGDYAAAEARSGATISYFLLPIFYIVG